MILSPVTKLQKNRFSGRKMYLPTGKMQCPTKKCTFLQKNAFSCRKMHFPAEKCGFWGAHAQEIVGGLQGSRIKNTSQLSQEMKGIHPKKFTRTSPKTWEDKFLGIPSLAPNHSKATPEFVREETKTTLTAPNRAKNVAYII